MNVPKLRFKEFTDEWNYEIFDNIIDIRSKSYNPNNNINYKCIELENINQGAGTINGYFNSCEQKSTKNIFYKNEVLFGKLRPYLKKYWYATFDGVCSSEIWVAKSKSSEKITNKFILYIFQTNYFLQLCNLSTGSKMPRADWDFIKEHFFAIPTLQEQDKIARFLSLLDKKIELQAKKIEVLKYFKKGLINYLFSQNTSMQITVKDLGTIITGTTPSKENKLFWDNGNIPWITPSDITYERDISNSMVKLTGDGLLNGRYLPKDSILVTCIASIGKNAVLKEDGSCNQQINAIIPNKKFNHNYIYYLMEYMSNYMKSIAGTSATSIINKNDFENLNVNVHSITEQIKIDKILSSIEIKEKLEDEYLHNITKLKSYLLQNMFI